MKIFTIPGTRSGFVLTLLIALLSMTAQTAWAFEVRANDVNWECTVIDGTTNVKIKPADISVISGAVTIPSTVTNDVTNYTVTEIESDAFNRCSGLTAVTVPSSVTKIGSYAFWICSNLTKYDGGSCVTVIEGSAFDGCSSLTSFTIPSGVTEIKVSTFKNSGLTSIAIPTNVTEIESFAFEGCSSLASVSIPASVTVIKVNPFLGCNNLPAITVDEGNPNYKAVNGVLFSKDDKTLIAYPGKHGTTYTIPASVTEISNSAFQDCSALTSVTIPTGVTKIGDQAFQGCSALTSVTIPTGVTKIGSQAFQGCSALTSVTIPASVTKIDGSTFKSCSALTSVTIPASVTQIGSDVFSLCFSLTSVTIYAKYLTKYEPHAFRSCNPTISIYVFRDCVSTYKTGWSNLASNIKPIPALTVNDAGGELGSWCSYYNGLANVTVPAGTAVYKASLNKAKTAVTLTEIYADGGIIAKGNAVLLKSAAPITLTSAATSGTGNYSNNDLKGVDMATAQAAGTTYYVLSRVGDDFGFFVLKDTSTTPATLPDLTANKAFFAIEDGSSGSRGFIGFGDDETTGISDASHLMDNGEWIMDNEAGAWYDLSGRKLAGQPTKKGIYVRDGQKFVIK